MPSIKNYEIFFVLVLTYNEGTSVNGREPFFVKVRHGQSEIPKNTFK